ncbi:uncharacterized protein STAUR_8055 [Stigmatella aurantiaca DW4/3-1]|uniref:Uncharacterized protein n=1 Tax=Stigmatella aurantiaca (strain DW4/3-1) TaxID=378806 RepID=E3FRN3_STIAD|nr:uncharacterized protein STAUR_8055 [Stigmatella aurantiaca DW4/3-1]
MGEFPAGASLSSLHEENVRDGGCECSLGGPAGRWAGVRGRERGAVPAHAASRLLRARHGPWLHGTHLPALPLAQPDPGPGQWPAGEPGPRGGASLGARGKPARAHARAPAGRAGDVQRDLRWPVHPARVGRPEADRHPGALRL